MITEVRLRNFKCFEELDLPLAPLTLLSGENGAGKSSVLQALLLLRQSAVHGALKDNGLVLNGELVRLGSFGTILRADAPFGASIDVGIAWDDHEEAWVRLNENQEHNVATWPDRPPSSRCRYVAADRIGPQAAFGMSDVHVHANDDIGARGEYAAHYLAVDKRPSIPLPGLCLRAEDFGASATPAASNKLKDQVEAWLGLVAPGVRLQVELHRAMDVVWLAFQFPGASGLSDPRRPTHVGFGLTYVLPLLVALLSARPQSLVIIENPEAHLHPRAQRLLVQLFARAAVAGVQVIVETHSDHILNGARVAVRRGIVPANDVRIHFFRQTSGQSHPEVLSPRVLDTGALSEWPAGFFDEWDRALDDLLG